jgi:low molecular weight protein-tyrosine phosphatase
MIRVLFVCTGNICRSPMAEAVFRHLVEQAGLKDQFDIDSAGTSDYHEGQRPHRGTLRVLEMHNIPCRGRSRPLTLTDLDKYDYIIAMDDENLADIKRLGKSKGTLARLLDYAPGQPVREVPDPYYSNAFEEVYGLVTQGAQGLVTHIRQKHNIG